MREGAVWGERAAWQRAVLASWPLLLALVLLAPMYVRGGALLARDLVWLPRHVLGDAAWGLADGPPRAVPLDSVVALSTQVVDGRVLARLVLPLVLALAGWGVAALLRDHGFFAQVVGAGFAVWNAYVVERLALGQWALLAAYAALPWVLRASVRFGRDGRARDLAGLTGWSAVASLTPTGGLIALGTVAAGVAGRRARGWTALVPVALLQLPWVVASLTGSGVGTSSGQGVDAFSPDTESPAGAVVALLGLGGIWDSGSEPATRQTWFALVAAVATLVVVVLGSRALLRGGARHDVRRLLLLAAVAASVAVVAATPPGRALLADLVATVPGAGLLRDTQKLLAPYAVVAALAAGALAASTARRVADRDAEVRAAVLLPVAAMPLLLLPDATTVTWPTATPVDYPDSLTAVADRVSGHGDRAVVTLPWRSYRAFSWAPHGLTSSDPLLRTVRGSVVVSDDLQVGSTLVPGEGPLASRVGEVVATGDLAALDGLGVGWLVVYPDDPEAAGLDDALRRSGAREVLRDDEVRLLELPGATRWPAESRGRRVLVLGAHGVAAATLLAALVVGGAASRRDMRRKGRRC